MQDARESLEALGGRVVGDDELAVSPEDQFESGFVAMAAGEAALVCGFIIKFVGVLPGLRPVYQPIWRELELGPAVGSDCAAARDRALGTLRNARQRIA